MPRTSLIVLLLLCATGVASAQFRTRAEEIEARRHDKRSRLWPERESPLVDTVNDLVERGLYSGARSGKGANGWQPVLGGMRSGQGVSFGIGWRKTDIWRERLGFRATARMTPQLAYLLDAELDFQMLESKKFFFDFYTKFESSPQMDYYGEGPNSSLDDRTSYLYDDFATDFRLGYDFTRWLRGGFTLGALRVHTGPGERAGVPSTDEVFDLPGFGEDTTFSRWGGFIEVDYRDHEGGPQDGGFYSATVREYTDEELGKFSFSQVLFQAQQYFPYFNKNRVIAMRFQTALAFREEGNTVPFYLQPKLGGNDDLRGFQRYRFYDVQSFNFNVEHRWHASSVLDMAVFVDAGKVTNQLADIDFSDLEWSAGIGFRFKVEDSYIMRIDFAGSRESFRFMWTFSDIFKTRWSIY